MDVSALTSLLERDCGLSKLLEGGKQLGIAVKTLSGNNGVVDFGSVKIDDLEILNPPPRGYEECEIECERELLVIVTVAVSETTNLPSTYTLESFIVLPSTEDSPFNISIVYPDGSDALGCTAAVSLPAQLAVRLTVKPTFRGHINHVVVLNFHGKVEHSPTSMSTSSCTVGVLVRGSFVDEDMVEMARKLSIDAKPFIPVVATSYFDPQWIPVYCNFGPNETEGRLPPFFQKALHEASSDHVQATEAMCEEYRVCALQNTLASLASGIACEPAAFDGQPYLSGTELVPWNEYLKKLGLLTCMEELQMDMDICQYDLRYQSLKFEKAYSSGSDDLTTTFAVNGSSENRPRVVLGDTVRIRPTLESLHSTASTALNDVYIEPFEMVGLVTHFDIQTERVTCRFGMPSMLVFRNRRNGHVPPRRILTTFLNNCLQFHMRFTFENFGFCFIHQALRQTLDTQAHHTLPQRLFPSQKYTFQPQLLNTLPSAILNRQQQEAVAAIAFLCCGPSSADDLDVCTILPAPIPPYIIYGPPGTGKTCTIIEAILETIRRNPSKRILACAPSDAAADVICKRLMPHISDSKLFRLNWWQRSIASVPPSLLKYCCVTGRGTTFDIPRIDTLLGMQVIVCTPAAAGVFRNIFIPRSLCECPYLQFDMVVVDEVSQATEAEVMVPLLSVKDNGVVVLVGDPEQLGPNPRTPVYHLSGMTRSLQERLLSCKLYSSIQPRVHVKDDESTIGYLFDKLGVYLVHNYRSQISIIHLPSRLFYGESLLESGDKDRLDSLGGWEELQDATVDEMDLCNMDGCDGVLVSRRRPFVVQFRGVDGTHRHDLDSPSFYNLDEVQEVVRVCRSLVQTLSLSSRDIGVIGAFRSQVLKLRIALRICGLGGINVGSVEDFQGQETRIIVVSTVLSRRIPSLEVKGALGLIGDCRKFNVAITRGMQLLVIVGNPHCLHTDSNWNALMRYCNEYGTYSGCPFSFSTGDSSDSLDEKKLLDEAARSSLLGGGVGEGVSGQHMMGGMSAYYADSMEWRGML